MNKHFATLANANVKHYDDHPTAHNILIVACSVVALVVFTKFVRKITKPTFRGTTI